jgi:hypothetical protein
LERELARAKRRDAWLLAVTGLAVLGLILAWILFGQRDRDGNLVDAIRRGIGTGAATTAPGAPTRDIFDQIQPVPPAQREVRAGRFILEDGNGKTRASLHVVSAGTMLVLYDSDGTPAASLGNTVIGSELLLRDTESGGCATLSAGCARLGEQGEPGLSLSDKNGKTRAWLSAEKGGPVLGLSDEKGQTRAGLGLTKEGSALMLCDEENRVRTELGVDKNGPVVRLFDENGAPRALLVERGLVLRDAEIKALAMLTVAKGGPMLSLSGEKGKLRAGVTITKGGPGLILLDENGKPCTFPQPATPVAGRPASPQRQVYQVYQGVDKVAEALDGIGDAIRDAELNAEFDRMIRESERRENRELHGR